MNEDKTNKGRGVLLMAGRLAEDIFLDIKCLLERALILELNESRLNIRSTNVCETLLGKSLTSQETHVSSVK